VGKGLLELLLWSEKLVLVLANKEGGKARVRKSTGCRLRNADEKYTKEEFQKRLEPPESPPEKKEGSPW